MDILDTGCELLMTPGLRTLMKCAGYFGHGPLLIAIPGFLWIIGVWRDSPRLRCGSYGVLLSLVVSGILTDVLKHMIGMPRPTGTGFGMPSGHTTAAFALAASLSVLIPTCQPLFYLLAIITGISRLYFRAHFVGDVISGALVGTVTGAFITRKLVRERLPVKRSYAYTVAWILATVMSLSALMFFWKFEISTGAYMVKSRDLVGQEGLRLDLDVASAKHFLRDGWTFNKSGKGQSPGIWAAGSFSSIALPAGGTKEQALRLRIKPYVGDGPVCETVRVHANDTDVATLQLEKGWHDYMVSIPWSALAAGNSRIEFWYDNAADRRPTRGGAKPTGIGFDRMILVARSRTLEEFGTAHNRPKHEPHRQSLAAHTGN